VNRVLGVLGTMMIVAAVVLLFVGGPADTGRPLAAPALVLMEPVDGAVVPTRVPVLFHVDAELRQQPGGWGVQGMHLHARVGEVELMPGPGDVERVAEGRYRWTIGPLATGEQTIRLVWSDDAHRPLEEGASAAVRVTIQ